MYQWILVQIHLISDCFVICKTLSVKPPFYLMHEGVHEKGREEYAQARKLGKIKYKQKNILYI